MAELDRSRHYGVIFGGTPDDNAAYTQDGKRFYLDGKEVSAVTETPPKAFELAIEPEDKVTAKPVAKPAKEPDRKSMSLDAFV